MTITTLTTTTLTGAGAAPVAAWTTGTPVGPLTVLTVEEVVVAAGFCGAGELWERLPDRRRGELVGSTGPGPVGEAVERYLAGSVDALDLVAVDQDGTTLQREVWNGLRSIPPGETRTYSELAATTSRPAAVRAAGTACGRNLIAPFVPCHRALRRDGSLGGYYYGLDVKRWLLDHEAGGVRSLAAP